MLFPAWETFYIVLGSAAGALTGLMFVVVALLANVDFGSEDALHAYATPTLVHFGGVLVLSMLLVVPWPSALPLGAALVIFAASGAIYMVIVWTRARRQKDYKPVFEDWLFYIALPIAAYLTILLGASILNQRAAASLFTIAAGAAVLLCVGIHNAWDNVIYITVGRREAERERARK